MIFLINEKYENLKLLSIISFIFILVSFVFNTPVFYFDNRFLLLIITMFMFGLIPIGYNKEFDFSLSVGFSLLIMLIYPENVSLWVVLLVNFIAFLIKNYKLKFKINILIAFINTGIILVVLKVAVNIFNVISSVSDLPNHIILLPVWILMLLLGYIILILYLKYIKISISLIKLPESYFFLLLSLYIFYSAFVLYSILIEYNIITYLMYIFTNLIFFTILHFIQRHNNSIFKTLNEIITLNKIKAGNEREDVGSFIKALYQVLNKYMKISAIYIKIQENSNKPRYEVAGDSKLEKSEIDKIVEKNKNENIFQIERYKTCKGDSIFIVWYPIYAMRKRVGDMVISVKDYSIVKDNLLFFKSINNKLAVIIENIELYNSLKSGFLKVIEIIISLIEAKDPLTAGHSVRVAKYSYMIGKEIELDKKELDSLKFAALLHDIGKIAIPESILKKEKELSESEFEIIRQHPIKGVKLLRKIDTLKSSFAGIMEHHERYDGKGYPYGKSGEDISLQGRIIAIADAFDAVTSMRIYRTPVKRIDAVAMVIDNGENGKFDPKLVDVFAKIINRSNGEYVDGSILDKIVI